MLDLLRDYGLATYGWMIMREHFSSCIATVGTHTIYLSDASLQI